MPRLRTLLALMVLAAPVAAGDWPQWLGPTRDGASPEKVLPWKSPPPVLWHLPVGEGHSSPVVANNRVFVHAKVKDKNAEEVIALDTQTGKVLWRTSYERSAFGSPFGNGPRATPAVSDSRVYTLGVTGILSCFDTVSGNKVWQVDTLKEFHASNLLFGVSCSPLVADGKVFVNVGGKGASIVAFDKDMGTVVWKNLDDKASYSSPILLGAETARQAVFLTQAGVVSINPKDGSLWWRFPLVDQLSESSITPVHVGDLLLAGTITQGSVALRLQNQEDKPGVKEEWKNADLTCYFSTPVAVGKEHVYLVTGSKPLTTFTPEATLRCIDAATGKERWHKAKVGKYHAALLRTGDDKLLLLEESGKLALLDPNPQEYRELAHAQVAGETWAHPALANGNLVVRDSKELVCIKLGE